MPAEMVLPLTFATFYICAVKKLSNLKQRICVNLLLRDIYPEKGSDGSFNTLDDTECSNYAKGKRPLSASLQDELNELSEKDIIERLKKLMVQDLAAMAGALRTLVKHSLLSETEKEELLKCYQEEERYTFIARVFYKCIRGDNCYPLTKMQTEVLQKYRDAYVSVNVTDGKSKGLVNQEFRSDSKLEFGKIENEDLGWIGYYVPASMLDTPIGFTDSRVVIQHEKLELPTDYKRMIYLLKPTLREAKLRRFTINEFIEAMDIDAALYKLRNGSLEYWQFEGTIDWIISMLQMIYFRNVSEFAVQLIGGFNLDQSSALETALKKVSNDNVTILSALAYKEATDVKLVLLAHRDDKKAKEQMLDTSHDNTHVYTMGRELKKN